MPSSQSLLKNTFILPSGTHTPFSYEPQFLIPMLSTGKESILVAFVDRSFWEEVTPNESTLLSDVPVGTLYDEDGRAERIVGGSTPGQVVLG